MKNIIKWSPTAASNSITRKKTKKDFITSLFRELGNIPIPTTKSPELQLLSEKMLQLNERLISLKGKQTDERIRFEKEIADTDKRIDELVYDLYGLTAEERQIVEESVK